MAELTAATEECSRRSIGRIDWCELRKTGLVTGLMDKLEHKLGLVGLRVRVSEVASQAAKTRGKENLRASCEVPGTTRTGSSPLQSLTAANKLPRSPSARKTWGAPVSPNDLIPRTGKIPAEILKCVLCGGILKFL